MRVWLFAATACLKDTLSEGYVRTRVLKIESAMHIAGDMNFIFSLAIERIRASVVVFVPMPHTHCGRPTVHPRPWSTTDAIIK